MKLTYKQKLALEAIEYYINENGYSPTYKELAKILNLKYINSAYNLVSQLEEKQYVKTKLGKARTIRVLKGLND